VKHKTTQRVKKQKQIQIQS